MKKSTRIILVMTVVVVACSVASIAHMLLSIQHLEAVEAALDSCDHDIAMIVLANAQADMDFDSGVRRNLMLTIASDCASLSTVSMNEGPTPSNSQMNTRGSAEDLYLIKYVNLYNQRIKTRLNCEARGESISEPLPAL